MKTKIPYQYRTLLFALIMSCTTSLIVSAIIIFTHAQTNGRFIATWLLAFSTAWPIVFAAILIIAPQVHRLLDVIVDEARND